MADNITRRRRRWAAMNAGPRVTALCIAVVALGASPLVARAGDASIITTVAGNGVYGFGGDGGLATGAALGAPEGARLDSIGNMYIADTDNNRIREVNPAGVISTFAGSGTFSFAGDHGAATKAALEHPGPVVVDSSGNVFIPDTGNCVIREVDASGTITTIAGIPNSCGNGSGQLNLPYDLALDDAHNLYVADFGNNRIVKLSQSLISGAWTISPYAGTGTAGDGGDLGPATSALLNHPAGVAVDSAGNLFIADGGNNRVRLVNVSGTITTFAGNGTPGNPALGNGIGSNGNGGLAIDAELNSPIAVAVDRNEVVYIADYSDSMVRRVGPDQIITTIAGTGVNGCSGDGGPAINATMTFPRGLGLDVSGNLYIADYNCNRIREATRPVIEADLTVQGVTLPVVGSITASTDQSGNLDVVVTIDGTTLPPIAVFTDGLLAQETPITVTIGGPTPVTAWVSAYITGHVTCLLSIGSVCAAPVPVNTTSPTTGEGLTVQVCTPTPDACMARSIPF